VRIGIGALAVGNKSGLGRLARTFLLALAVEIESNPELAGSELYVYFRHRDDLKLLVEECGGRDPAVLNVIRPHFPTLPGGRVVWEEFDIPRTFADAGLDVWLGLDFTLPARQVAPLEAVVLPDLLPFTRPATVGWRARLLYRNGIRRAIQRGARFICISETTRQKLVEFAPQTETRAAVVYPPLSPTLAHYAGDDPMDMTRLQIMGSLNMASSLGPFLLSVGTLGPRKNTQLLVNIHRELVLDGTYRGSLVLIGGDGRYHTQPTRSEFAFQAIGSMLDQGSRAAAVHDLGRVNDHDLSLLYRNADLVVSLSAEEGLGYPVLEALAYGTPAVVTAGSSMLEIADGGIAATELEPEACRRNIAAALGALPLLRREAQQFDPARFSLAAAGRKLAAILAGKPELDKHASSSSKRTAHSPRSFASLSVCPKEWRAEQQQSATSDPANHPGPAWRNAAHAPQCGSH
jgi:glycosyltransferase involved in cell wall biosynthesis